MIQASPKLIDQILLQPFHLIAVNNIPDEELREHLWSGVMAFVMKHIHARDTLSFLQKILRQLHQLELADGTEHVILLLNYFLVASNIQDIEKFISLIQKAFSPQVGEQIMTLAERIREEGYQRGLTLAEQFREKGLLAGEAAFLTRLLTRKFGAISTHYQERIQQADADILLHWGERTLDANTLEEVFYSPVTL